MLVPKVVATFQLLVTSADTRDEPSKLSASRFAADPCPVSFISSPRRRVSGAPSLSKQHVCSCCTCCNHRYELLAA